MGLFEKIFGRRPASQQGGAFETLTAYRPAFRDWGGQLYESELIRAAVDARARHISKLAANFTGSAKPSLRAIMKNQPNEWQTWSQFLYRTSTILDMQSTAFIVPVLDEYGDISGFFTVLPSQCEVVDVNGEPWLRYHFNSGKIGSLALAECGILTRFQYKDDLFGTPNSALNDTLSLIYMQKQGIQEGIKNGSTFRFMATVTNFTKSEDLAKERKRFNKENLRDESGGVLLWPNTYKDIKQIDQKAYTIDADQMKLIQQNVYNFFGVSEDILQNKCFGDAWSAFYEGAVEPFALQISEAMTDMTYTQREKSTGNRIFFTANRLQYMSNNDKLNVSAQMADRGIMTRNEIREIWNLAPLPPEIGDKLPVRGEYHILGEEDKGGDQDAGEAGPGVSED